MRNGNSVPVRMRLMGQSRNSSDVPGVRDIRTASTSRAFMTDEVRESLESAMDWRALEAEANREKAKFARQDAAVEKFQQNYFRVRERLAGTINKNRMLMELRHELQKKRCMGEGADLNRHNGRNTKETKAPVGQAGFNEVELKY